MDPRLDLPLPVADALASDLGQPVVEVRAVSGGYTPARRQVIQLADGATAFVKYTDIARMARWLDREIRIYREVQRDFMPRMLAAGEADGWSYLVLEDLSHAHWPPPWRPGDIDVVLEALAEVRATPGPSHLRTMTENARTMPRWATVAADPAPFLSLGLCSPAWLERCLDTLVQAEERANFEGNDLMHVDTRSDNLCIGPGGVKFVDWNWAVRGNGLYDVAFWLPSLHHEGGPPPIEIMPDQPEFAARVSGYFAANAGQPVGDASPAIRVIQRAQLVAALPWVVQSLGLPAPDR